MIYIKKGRTNKVVVTITQHQSDAPTKYFLFSFQHVASKETVRFYMASTLVSNNRYDEYTFDEVTGTSETVDPLIGKVKFNYTGQYFYSVYEMGSQSLDPSTARRKLEEGRAYVDGKEETVYFNPYISDNEDNSNYVYMS